ncbi:hypothetical protein AB0L06_34530 [Spirillospora sp. NPDC052269]
MAVRTSVVTTALVAVLGPVAGLVWHAVAPAVGFVVVHGEPFIADGESQAPIGTDVRLALIGLVAGLLCGLVAYWFGGRDNDVPLLIGLALGGTAASLLAWWVGHRFGLSHYQHVLRTGADGTEVRGPADVRAKGVLVFWPLAAVATYAVLEILVKRLPATSTATQPAETDVPSADGNAQPAANGEQPADGGEQPADGARPADGGARPATNGEQPADGGARPAEGGAQSAANGEQSADARSAANGELPAGGGGGAAAGGHPSGGDDRSSNEGGPAADNGHPPDGGTSVNAAKRIDADTDGDADAEKAGG